MPDSSQIRRQRRLAIEEVAWGQGGVLGRRQMYAAGVTRAEVLANLRADRWRRLGSQTICVHRGPLTQQAKHWAAVLEAGPRAYLDGASSLVAGGLQRYVVERVRVSVPRGARVRRHRGLDIRQTRRFDPEDVTAETLPRSRNPIAAVRAALWARSDKEAALVLTMTVQQGLARAEEIGEALLKVRRDKRRGFLNAVVLDMIGGVRSLGELDLAGELRRRGLPEPDRQVIRRAKNKKCYLDLYWDEWRVVVEVDGIHHSWAQNVVSDAVRHNAIALDRDVVLRLPLLGLRLEPDTFFTQIAQALRDGGWRGELRRTA